MEDRIQVNGVWYVKETTSLDPEIKNESKRVKFNSLTC